MELLNNALFLTGAAVLAISYGRTAMLIVGGIFVGIAIFQVLS
jgi:hypothetical protein